MRDLTVSEVKEVSGGISWAEGGLAIIALGFSSPVTALFGAAIGGSMLFIDYQITHK